MRNNTANCEIRKAARKAGVNLWQIAAKLGFSEATMTRRMRAEMTDEEKDIILSVIADIGIEQEAE